MRYDQIVDREGVLAMIQGFRYRASDMIFEVTTFTGQQIEMCGSALCPSLGLMQCTPTRMQFLEALNAATLILQVDYKMWRQPV